MSTAQWRKENTETLTIRFLKKSTLYEGFLKAIEETQVAQSAYIKAALQEKLERDGYLVDDTYAGPHGTLKLPKD